MSAVSLPIAAPPLFELWLLPLQAGAMEADLPLLDDHERTRADRFVFAPDRRRFVAAHAGLRRLLGQRLGQAPQALRFETGAHGKPRLRGEAVCAFSLSHSGDHALVALADEGEIGVDLEQVKPLGDIEALARQCLGPRERTALAALAPAERDVAFLRAWTRKEACLKALGTGLRLEPAGVETGLDAAPLRLALATPEGGRELELCSLSLPPGWVGALAWLPARPKWGNAK